MVWWRGRGMTRAVESNTSVKHEVKNLMTSSMGVEVIGTR